MHQYWRGVPGAIEDRNLAPGVKRREQFVRENGRVVLRNARIVLSKSKRPSCTRRVHEDRTTRNALVSMKF